MSERQKLKGEQCKLFLEVKPQEVWTSSFEHSLDFLQILISYLWNTCIHICLCEFVHILKKLEKLITTLETRVISIYVLYNLGTRIWSPVLRFVQQVLVTTDTSLWSHFSFIVQAYQKLTVRGNWRNGPVAKSIHRMLLLKTWVQLPSSCLAGNSEITPVGGGGNPKPILLLAAVHTCTHSPHN